MSFKRNDINVRELINGNDLTISTFEFQGTDSKAPKTYIQANVHGAETQGNAVIYQLIQYLSKNPPKGSVTLVPQANPFASNYKLGEGTYGRFDPSTGDNWNRVYFPATINNEQARKYQSQINIEEFVQQHKDLPWDEIKLLFKDSLKKFFKELKIERSQRGLRTSERMALSLQELATDADIVLDLHTGPEAVRYLYAPDYTKESACYFGIPHVLIMPTDFAGAMDEASFHPWVQLQNELKNQGQDFPIEFDSYTVELGGEETISLKDSRSDAEGILNYLTFKGALEGEAKKPEGLKACLLSDYKAFFSEQAGLVNFIVSPGEIISKGQVVCEILSFKNLKTPDDLERCVTPILAHEDGILVFHATSSSAHQGQEVFNMMTNIFPLS
jgi:predicted deacylase